MYPLYKNGEKVFCLKVFSFSSIKLHDIVIFNHDKEGLMIKEVIEISDKGYYVKGTSAYSIDSSIFGYLQKEDFLYKALFKF